MKKKICFLLAHMEEIVAGGCLTVMVTVTFVNTVGRYFFNHPLTWGDEFSMMLGAWATFLGMAAAYKRNQHLGMEFFVKRLSPKNQLIQQRFITLTMATLNTVLMVISWQYVISASKRTPVMRLSYKYIYASAAVGFTFMTIYAFFFLYQSFFQKEAFMEWLSGKQQGDDNVEPTEEESK